MKTFLALILSASLALAGLGTSGGSSGGGAPSGSAGGDLSGTYPNPTVAGTGKAYTVNTQAGDYTLILTDAQKLVRVAATKQLTIPLNASVAFPAGSWVDVQLDGGSGGVTVGGDTGVSLEVPGVGDATVTVRQGQTVRVSKVGTNAWMASVAPYVVTAGAMLKSLGPNSIGDAVPGTDYAPATSGSAILMGNGAGGFSSATANTDYLAYTPLAGFAAPSSAGNKATTVSDYSGSGIDGGMAAALNLVAAGIGDAIQQDEARLKELIPMLQAMLTAFRASQVPAQ